MYPSIETALVSDAEEILSLQKLAYQSEAKIYGDDSIPPLVQTLEEMKSDLIHQKVLKAIFDQRSIIGSVRAFEKHGTCYIGRLIVHPDFRNHGIGARLMNEIELLFDSTAKRFELFTGSKSKNNIRLYQKLGYKIFKTEIMSENVTAVFFEKRRPPIML